MVFDSLVFWSYLCGMNKDNTIHISKELHKQVKLYCVENNMNIREYIEMVVSIDLNNRLGIGNEGKPLFLEKNEEVDRELDRLFSKL